MNIKLEQYKIFNEAASTLSFSLAARNLFISQSAVSQAIRLLEKELQSKKKSITEFMKQENIDVLLKEFKVATLEDFYFQLGSNKISVKALFKEDKQEPLEALLVIILTMSPVFNS